MFIIMYKDLRVKYRLFLADFNQIWIPPLPPDRF